MTEPTKPLTEAQINHLVAIHAAFMQAQQRVNEFVAYLQAEHDAPANEWQLRNPQIGFERIPEKPGSQADSKTALKEAEHV